MAFYEQLDRVAELLRRRGRASHRALQREFGPDAGLLEDLRAELVDVQRLARDEGGAVLVWLGDADGPPPIGALEVACGQRAKSLELRAATSLSPLWQRQNEREDARRLLAGTFSWFTDEVATPDLREARTRLTRWARRVCLRTDVGDLTLPGSA